MKPGDVFKMYGSLYRFRKDTGMSANSLFNWMKWGYVPIESQFKLEEMTNGELKADWQDTKHK